MAVGPKVSIAEIGQYLGLRTDTPQSKCPSDYSPDCYDMVFSVGGMATRNPFKAIFTMPAETVWRKEFTCKDGSVQILALDVNGVLYSIANGSASQLDTVTPGSSVNSVTAYGREYMAFYNADGGCDAPRQWDGKNLYRVSQGGPGAPPRVSNYSYPSVALIAGSSGSAVTITSAKPIDPVQVQVGRDQYYGGGFQPPQFVTYFTALQFVTAAPHGFTNGEVVTIAGNSLYNLPAATVTVVNSTVFTVSFQTQSGAVGTGGHATPSTPFLVRTGNIVASNTASPHNLRVGYQALIAGVPDQTTSVNSIAINNESKPGIATFTTSAPHGFVPGNTVGLSGVQDMVVGTISTWALANGSATITMTAPHNLVIGDNVFVAFAGFAGGPHTVVSVPSSTVFTFALDNGLTSGSGGTVTLPWPDPDGTQFQITAVPTPTTFEVQFNFSDGTWITGTLSFPWNGTFYVTSVPSSTSFTYSQAGPDALIQSGSGTVTPYGQIAAGVHQVCQHFVTRTGFITAPSPSTKFTASGGQYAFVQDLLIGGNDIVGRILSFTGANGSKFFVLDVPGIVNGIQVSTSTLVNDNITTSAIMDFGDPTLLSALGVDIPGNNLFQQVALNLPNGVSWYYNRLFWKGEKNTVIGFQNLDMAGGTLSGSSAPAGWSAAGSGGIQQIGIKQSYVGSGTLSQAAATSQAGNVIIQPNLNYSIRAWGNGSVIATFVSASTGFSSTANLTLTGSYLTAGFSNALPANVPPDLTLILTLTDVVVRDIQFIYADNPNRNPLDRASYVQNPEAYDALTGNIGPSDDNSELRANFVLQESFHFITEKNLFSVEQVGNAEPSSWEVVKVDDKCGAFQNAVVKGQGWAAWGGPNGGFWYGGGLPTKTTAVITPTWRSVVGISNIFDDNDNERVYFGVVNAAGNKSILVYDYHEVNLGGGGKWCPWNRPSNWISESANGPVFTFGKTFYSLSNTAGIEDDNLGSIGGYYTFAPVGESSLKKQYDYLGLMISGMGTLTPFLYSTKLQASPYVLNGADLAALIDVVAEWPTLGLSARLLYLKLGQPGVQYALEDASIIYKIDPNSPYSGAR